MTPQPLPPPAPPSLPPARWRTRAIESVLREALTLVGATTDDDEAAALLVPLFFAPSHAAHLSSRDRLTVAALAYALRTCLGDRSGSAVAWSMAQDLINDLLLRTGEDAAAG